MMQFKINLPECPKTSGFKAFQGVPRGHFSTRFQAAARPLVVSEAPIRPGSRKKASVAAPAFPTFRPSLSRALPANP